MKPISVELSNKSLIQTVKGTTELLDLWNEVEMKLPNCFLRIVTME